MYDLIVPKKRRTSLNVREAAGEGIFLEGLSEIEVGVTSRVLTDWFMKYAVH